MVGPFPTTLTLARRGKGTVKPMFEDRKDRARNRVREPPVLFHGGVSSAGKGLVLVVEDDRSIADVLRLYLSRAGFGVHVEHEVRAG
jgi:hypothetical protein